MNRATSLAEATTSVVTSVRSALADRKRIISESYEMLCCGSVLGAVRPHEVQILAVLVLHLAAQGVVKHAMLVLLQEKDEGCPSRAAQRRFLGVFGFGSTFCRIV